ncbi:hypothetical protein PAMP_011573 [Pampus punctatissimus]
MEAAQPGPPVEGTVQRASNWQLLSAGRGPSTAAACCLCTPTIMCTTQVQEITGREMGGGGDGGEGEEAYECRGR